MSDVVFLVLWLAMVAGTIAICGKKGRPVLGIFLGLFLGIFGLLIALLVPVKGYACPYCRGHVPNGATICSMCRSNLIDRGE